MAIKSLSVRKKSRMSAWRRSTSSTKKPTEHPRWFNLCATAAWAATVAAAAARISAVEAAIMAARATAAIAVASASLLAAAEAAAAEAAEAAVGAGNGVQTWCRYGYGH